MFRSCGASLLTASRPGILRQHLLCRASDSETIQWAGPVHATPGLILLRHQVRRHPTQGDAGGHPHTLLRFWLQSHQLYGWVLGVAAGAKNVMEWILQPIFMKIPILETHWHQEEPWQMSLTYIEVLWICPLDRRLFKLQFVNSVCKICQNLNRKRSNNSISCLKHCFLKNNMWKNKQNTTTWYKCRVFCWDFDTFCRLN